MLRACSLHSPELRSVGVVGLLALAFQLLLVACGSPDPEVVAPAPPRRAIEPAEGEISSLGFARVQIGSETRSVIAARPRVVLRDRERVPLDGDVDVDVRLPADLADAWGLRVEARVSLPPPGLRPDAPLEEAAEPAGRRILSAPVALLFGEARARVRLVVPVGPGDSSEGQHGLLEVVARPLGEDATEQHEIGPFTIGPRDRLVFGYGVEPEGWDSGWPAVRFRVLAYGVEGQELAVPPLFDRRIDPARDERDRRWLDASVGLGSLAGRRVRLRFEIEALGELPGGAPPRSFGVVSNPEIVSGSLGAPLRPARRNLVLVSLDTLRARSLDAYGHGRTTMPQLTRRIAAQGTLMRSVVTPFPYTPPGHMSMLTGLDLCAHGVRDRHGVLAANQPTLAERLRAAGYRTAAVTEDAYVVAGAGFARGFDTYYEILSDATAAPGFAAETFARARRWLGSVDERPFFLFLHTYQVHDPYTPPSGYDGLFRDGLAQALPEAYRKAFDDYEREIRYTDDLLAGFLDSLQAHGLSDTTLLVVTSDHGEQFGEHFFAGHGFDAHDEALLVPLVMRAPGLVAAGRVVEEQVGLIDLVPTLLDLLGLDPPSDLQGTSFAERVATAAESFAPFVERPLVSEAAGSRTLRTRRFKYHVGTRKRAWQKLYRLDEDPAELRDVAEEEAEAVAWARRQLEEHDAACEAWLRAHPPQPAEVQAGRTRPGWMVNRDEIEQRLRSLGYVID